MDYPRGEKIAEGKTKVIWAVENAPGLAILESKDDITAGDGAKHDVIAGKAEMATATTCNVFELLKRCGVPVAYREQVDSRSFLGDQCRMLPWEVVVRREGHGSYLKRAPWLQKGHVFPRLIVEFFLKTTGKKWEDNVLPKDDPLAISAGDGIALYLPDKPLCAKDAFLRLQHVEGWTRRDDMARIARQVFLVLEKAWQSVGRKLVDFKIEFGLNAAGELLVADVIDNDSWRVVEGQHYIDKQSYRDGEGLDAVTAKYRHVMELTGNFSYLPVRSKVLLWVGSEKDDTKPYLTAFGGYFEEGDATLEICSMHKEPVRGYSVLVDWAQNNPDSVIVASIGRSNGAGPTLSAQVSIPVVTVPAAYREFPEDVWSSLRMPSEVPVMTVLEPANAVLAALQILAMRNPKLYMMLRMKKEEKLSNVILLE